MPPEIYSKNECLIEGCIRRPSRTLVTMITLVALLFHSIAIVALLFHSIVLMMQLCMCKHVYTFCRWRDFAASPPAQSWGGWGVSRRTEETTTPRCSRSSTWAVSRWPSQKDSRWSRDQFRFVCVYYIQSYVCFSWIIHTYSHMYVLLTSDSSKRFLRARHFTLTLEHQETYIHEG